MLLPDRGAIEGRIVVQGVRGYEDVQLNFARQGLGHALQIPPFVGGKVHDCRPGSVSRNAHFFVQVEDGFVHLFVFVTIPVEVFDVRVFFVYFVIPKSTQLYQYFFPRFIK